MGRAGREDAWLGGVVTSVPSKATLPTLQTCASGQSDRNIGGVRIYLTRDAPSQTRQYLEEQAKSHILSLLLIGVDILQLTLAGGEGTVWSSSEIKLQFCVLLSSTRLGQWATWTQLTSKNIK